MIETKRLLLRQHAVDDWRDLYAYLSLPETYRFEPGQPLSEEEARRLIEERAQAQDFLAVVLKKSAKMIGHLYFKQSEPLEFLTWELGYIFHPAYHNCGYATEAAGAIVAYAFREYRAHRIEARCNPENPASWHVLEKIGMQREGYFPQKAFFRRDAAGRPLWHDCYAYGVLEPQEGRGPL